MDKEIEWETIDSAFRHYAWLCSRPPTMDALIAGIMKGVEATREIFEGYYKK